MDDEIGNFSSKFPDLDAVDTPPDVSGLNIASPEVASRFPALNETGDFDAPPQLSQGQGNISFDTVSGVIPDPVGGLNTASTDLLEETPAPVAASVELTAVEHQAPRFGNDFFKNDTRSGDSFITPPVNAEASTLSITKSVNDTEIEPPTLQAPEPSFGVALGKDAPLPQVVLDARAEQAKIILEREQEDEKVHQETIARARAEIDNFYKEYNVTKERNVAQNKTEEDAAIQERNNALGRGTLWDRVIEIIELDGNKGASKDLTRFTQILRQLKNDGDRAPGAAGYTASAK